MARALGGRVAQHPGGWGLGVTRVRLTDAALELFGEKDKDFQIIVSHQDQVTAPPENAQCLAGSDFCPYFVLRYAPCFLSIQGHPEFSRDFMAELLKLREDSVSKEQLAQATHSLQQPVDNARVAGWMLRHYQKKNTQKKNT